MADSATGLSASEAQAFHGFFMMSTIVYAVVALIAHILVWQWRSWFPGEEGYASLMNTATSLINYFV
jgi:light-harvesting complex 1 beta chain